VPLCCQRGKGGGLSNVGSELLEEVIAIARDAGRVIMDCYSRPSNVSAKQDGSPVTDADERAEALILTALAQLTPNIPVIAEEAVSRGRSTEIGPSFWLVDPLDGTREFISRSGEFTVNIGLIEKGRPALGVVLAPALGRLFAAVIGKAVFAEEESRRRPITCRTPPPEGVTVVSSRSHGDAAALKSFLHERGVERSVSAGSSLKFCLIASGDADLYPRFGNTMEWDTAAAHAILAAAGGQLTDLLGRELTYGKRGFLNPPFIATGKPSCAAECRTIEAKATYAEFAVSLDAKQD